MNEMIPDYLRGNRRQLNQDTVAGMGLPPVPYLSIGENKFTLVDAAGQTWEPNTFGPIVAIRGNDGQLYPAQGSPVGLFIDLVVVDSNPVISKIYYPNLYTPDSKDPPTCWSDNGVAPSTGALHPQNDTCELCPHNRWGSKVNALGNEVKACDDVRKLGVVVPQVLAQFGLKTVFLFRLKGSSHKNWVAYINRLSRISLGDRPCDVTDVVTRVFYQPGKLGVLDFTNIAHIDQAVAALEDEIWTTHATDQMLGKLDKPRAPTGLQLTAPGQQRLAPPAVQPPPPVTPPTGFGAAQQAPPQPGPQPSFGAAQQPATQAAAFQQQEAPRKRGGGRPRKDGTPAGSAPAPAAAPAQGGFGAAPAAPATTTQPPFGGTTTAAPFPSQPPAQAAPAPSFGMAQPGQAPAAVSEALKSALGPLPPR